MKNILVVSYNAIPVTGTEQVEGTGLRGWRLATGLRRQGHKNVTIAIKDTNAPSSSSLDGIAIKTYTIDKTNFKQFLKGYDVIIFSYAYGRFSLEIIESAPKQAICITDAYSPYYIEALSSSTDKKEDQHIRQTYKEQIIASSQVLLKSDYILVANEVQRSFYEGVIAGLGAAPVFDFERILVVPPFSENADINHQEMPEKLNILWFGGMYPWFNPMKLIEFFSDKRVSTIAQLTVVGGWNPMYPKDNKRFNGQFSDFYECSKKKGLINTSVFYKDWVGYKDRLKIFEEASVAVSINNPGPETKYSFRLRIADLAGNGVPILTNGGDPLSEWLINTDRAIRYDFLNSNVNDFYNVIKDRIRISQVAQNLRTDRSKEELQIDTYLKRLSDIISEAQHNPISNTSSASFFDEFIQAKKISRTLEYTLLELQHQLELKDDELKLLQSDLSVYIKDLNDLQRSHELLHLFLKAPLKIIKRMRRS